MNVYRGLCVFRIAILLVILFGVDQVLNSGFAQLGRKFHKHVKRKEEIIQKYKSLKQKNFASCSSTVKTAQAKLQHLSRHPRSAGVHRKKKTKTDTAVYFSGKELLKLRTNGKMSSFVIPNREFTVSLWIKPEGGQHDPISILGLFDICTREAAKSWWSLGIQSFPQSKLPSPRIYFSMQTDRSSAPTIIYSTNKYSPNVWSHITITYDQSLLKMYIGNTMVAASQEQRGGIFDDISRRCKEIHLGGNLDQRVFYRGTVDEIKFYNVSLTHTQVISNLQSSASDLKHNAIFYDKFVKMKNWRKALKKMPHIVPSNIQPVKYSHFLRTPPCGETICDDPVLVKSYLDNEQLRTTKNLRYRVVNLSSDDGQNPQVSKEQIQVQHITLQDIFNMYNISWELEPDTSLNSIKNSSLKEKLLMFACDPWNVGDGICNKECIHYRTAKDGGDCEPFIPACNMSSLGNGHCDYECNKEYHRWDLGDCCIPGPFTHLTCADPSSPNRGYLGINEYKELIGLDGLTQLNIYMAPRPATDLVGLSTLPWDKDVHGVLGGTVIQQDIYGKPGRTKELIHEMGHTLGLWHVHRGISELDCGDPCIEREPSLEVGDLCSDTNPTPVNKFCREPDGTSSSCGVSTFTNTPYRNFMSYADDSCTDHFTPEQTARMHCYIDLVFQTWSTSKDPAPVPLAPRIIEADNSSVTVAWIPPLGSRHVIPTSLCDVCTDEWMIVQHGSNATSSYPESFHHIWTSQQAVGPPDAEPCEMSDRAWMPDADKFDCLALDCYVDIWFAFPVVPKQLTLWVVYTEEGGIDEVELVHTDGSSTYLGPYPAFCDTELTISLDVRLTVSSVRIYVNNPHVSIDAAELTTIDNYPDCQSCRSRKYILTRDPPFPFGETVQTSQPEYRDSTIEQDTNYTYAVYISSSQRKSVLSPSLTYTAGQPFCGDGIVDQNDGEICDDGNVIDGDGCDIHCKMEDSYNCKGSPSICYVYDGDGICEPFEKSLSGTDCGFFTPKGFEDQWAISAVANPQFQLPRCPESVVIGPPKLTQVCKLAFNTGESWHPCGHLYEASNFWIEVYFAKAVVATEIIIYLGSDGTDEYDKNPRSIRVELLTTTQSWKLMRPETMFVSCAEAPIHIPVTKDLSTPFFLTKGVRLRFSAFNLSISAVRLRSSTSLNTIKLAKCQDNEVYNPRSGKCIPKDCNLPSCGLLYIKRAKTWCSGYREGDICNVTCDVGYRTKGFANEFVCVNGSWSNPASVSCVRVDCGKPEIPYGLVACPDGTLLDSKCTFKCKHPARVQGDITTIQCQADGYWSLPKAYCQVQCTSPHSLVRNANLVTKKCKKSYHSVHKRCRFKCHKGFHVEGKKTSQKFLKRTCADDGQWKGHSCVRISCPPISPVFTGLYKCTDINHEGSKCRLRCPGEEVSQIIKCTSSGEWSGTFKMCSSGLQGKCPKLPTSDDIVFKCNDNYVGYQCDVTCVLPNSKPILAGRTNKVRGRLNGPISKFIPVRQLTCTALLEWKPDPATLLCVENCNVEYINDGWCDAENNREQCEWDGGDCCHSTSVEGVSISFPGTCTKNCKCLDPNAEENQRKGRRKGKRKKSKKKKGKKNKKDSKQKMKRLKRYIHDILSKR